MPSITCSKCGESWIHDMDVIESIDACPKCKKRHKIVKLDRTFKVEPLD